jgi:heavy metal sensor kinase
MFRSIRWSVQMWHAAILATVLVAFGWVVFHLLRVTTYQQIDAELNRTADLVVAGLRPRGGWPRRESRNDAARGELRRGEAGDNEARRPRGGQSSPAPPSAQQQQQPPVPEPAAEPPLPGRTTAGGKSPAASQGPRPPETARRSERPERQWEVSEDFLRLFEEAEGSPPYYVVWRGEDRVILKSKSAPDLPLPELRANRNEPPLRGVRQRGHYREVLYQTRFGTNILVGRSIEADLAALRETGFLLVATGVSVLAAGLLGGHWFSRRAIRPIETISATAAEISVSNLSHRIDVSGTETELTGLARTLNETFDRLEAAFAQQVRFTADASHELRTPVSVILSHSELALGKDRSPEELRRTLDTCRRAALRMKALVESLLTLARFDSGERLLEFRTFDLARLAADSAELVRPLADERRIAVELDLTPTCVSGDPDRLSQVITNLLTNAIRYNRDGGRVRLAVGGTAADAVLTVEDTGVGIAVEHLPHIFERFYRVDAARTRRDGGTGLGLAICKSIVEAHRGRISVASLPEGGTTFEVRVPKQDLHRDAAAHSGDGQPAREAADALAAAR